MKSASLKDIKTALESKGEESLLQICLRVAKFKQENKELLTYLLFEKEDEAGYVQHIKELLAQEFSGVNSKSIYIAKKNIRRILRLSLRYVKYSEEKTTKVEVGLFVVESLLGLPANVLEVQAVKKIIASQREKLSTLINTLHEDLQYDYHKQLNALFRLHRN